MIRVFEIISDIRRNMSNMFSTFDTRLGAEGETPTHIPARRFVLGKCLFRPHLFFCSETAAAAAEKTQGQANRKCTMSGALPQQPEEFLDHVRHFPHDHVPSVEEELDEYLMLREVRREVQLVQQYGYR